MPRRARIHYVSLRSSLVNLPISIYGPLVERSVRPQGLAVHLKLVSPTKPTDGVKGEAYVGWTGMASASSLAHFNAGNAGDKGLETIDIDPQFSEGLGFAEGDIVEIGLLHDLGYASSVATEPLTPDDWEILELHASHVESTLLSQVRVAMIGQEIDVWVLGRTRVRLRVVSLEPSTRGKALLLTTSTEVSIAPKTRPKAGSSVPNGASTSKSTTSGASNVGNNASSDAATSSSPDENKKTKRSRIFRAIPPRVLPPFSPSCPALDDGTVVSVAFVSQATLRFLDPNDPSTRLEPHPWITTVRRLAPPPDPTQEQQVTPAPAPVPRVLVPSDPTASKAATQLIPPQKEEVLITWSPEVPVPDGLIVFHGSVGGIEDWDLVKVDFEEEDSEYEITSQPPQVNGIVTRSTRSATPKLAGVDDIIAKCDEFCLAMFIVHSMKQRVCGVPGLLVTGRSGAGKTSILNVVAKHAQDDPRTFAYTLYVDLAKYTEAPVSKIKSLLKYWFEKAQWHRPSIIIMDNMDKLMGVEQEHADSFRQRHITELFIRQYGSGTRTAPPNAKGMLLLGSAESKTSLHPLLFTCHAFQETVHLKPPGKDARKEIISHVVQGHLDASDLIQDPSAPLNYTALAMETEGYSATDLKDLVARAVHQAAIRVSQHEDEEDYQPTLVHADFVKAHADFVPLSLRDVKLHKSDVAWADIGGLKETKQVLRETLEWPTKYGPIFAQSPLRLRQGLLLYGYPGCGKTLLASAVAKECGLNFISVKGPELLNKYIGASEQSVRELFERASAAKPCVLFFDEFDSIAPKRGHDSTGVTDRVVNQMLTQLDGVEGLNGVYVLAATSRPDLIDSALLRPGRLDKSLLCPMPDLDDRKEILEAVSRKVTLAPSVNLADIAEATDGFSGADLQALLYNAHLEVIHEVLAATKLDSNGPNGIKTRSSGADDRFGKIQLTHIAGPTTDIEKATTRAEKDALQRRMQRILSNTMKTEKSETDETPQESLAPEKHEIMEEHVRRVLKTMRPSVPHEERLRFERIYNAFVDARSGKLPVPPDAGGVGHRVTLM